jgi:hypothetical protein
MERATAPVAFDTVATSAAADTDEDNTMEYFANLVNDD